jgi:hypothetical protein
MAARLCRSTLLGKTDEEAAMPTIGVHDSTLYRERSGQDPAMPFIHDGCGPDVWADEAEGLPLLHRAARR